MLHNKVDKEILKKKALQSVVKRCTLSFYQYTHIADPVSLRDEWYGWMTELDIKGRIYIAVEGVNAQISIPSSNLDRFLKNLGRYSFLAGIRLNRAIQEESSSFFMLKIKVRNKIVADGLPENAYDLNNRGIPLSAGQFNKLTDLPETILVDIRNHYESEVGHFRNAICPDVETFREALIHVSARLKKNKKSPLVLYCTGGIRCEKASAYLINHGFENVYQLDGGIVSYVKEVREKGLKNKFLGTNFVFDERLGERITEDIVANCHQCGMPCDHHTNCANDHCHILFIQCPSCREKFQGCCSKKCNDFKRLPFEQRKCVNGSIQFNGTRFGKGRYRAFRKSEGMKIN